MQHVPAYVTFVFLLATVFVYYALFRATNRSRLVLYLSVAWLALQAVVTGAGFYLETKALPPRFIFLPLPPLILILVLFLTKRGRSFIDSFDQGWLTLLHVVRIPVELVLFWLFVGGLVPEIMTFEGRNFDVFSGISAVGIYYLVFVKGKGGKGLMLVWNIICLLLLFNIVITAILAAPSPIQQIAFEQPNTGIFYFPFSWLPAFIVPAVFLAHLASIRFYTKSGN